MKSHVCDNMLHGCTDQRLIYPYINSYGGILVMHIRKYEKKTSVSSQTWICTA